MKIGILSDTHDRAGRTLRAVQLLQGQRVEALVHCGDLTGPEIVRICGVLPCYYVFGNNDYDPDGLRAAMEETGGVCLEWGSLVELDGRRIAVTHGDLPREFRRLLELEPDYLLYGHTHVPLSERDGPTRQVNPGALHRATAHTVAVLDTEHDAVTFHEVT